jgi:hypothetical protein
MELDVNILMNGKDERIYDEAVMACFKAMPMQSRV